MLKTVIKVDTVGNSVMCCASITNQDWYKQKKIFFFTEESSSVHSHEMRLVFFRIKEEKCLTLHVWLGEESPPAGTSAGVDHSPQELSTAQLHRLHLRAHLLHAHHCTQQQRQKHHSPHTGCLECQYRGSSLCPVCSSETTTAPLSWAFPSVRLSSALQEAAISRSSTARVPLQYIGSTFHFINAEHLPTSL